jgi:hypothetical protein
VWWWCGGGGVVVDFLTDNITTPTKVVLSCFGLLVGLWQQGSKIVTSQHTLNNPPQENKVLEMPEYLILEDGRIMALRNFAAVLRRHKFSQERDPHEYFYSENMLFHPWYSESELFPNDAAKCQSLFEEYDDAIDGKYCTKIQL